MKNKIFQDRKKKMVVKQFFKIINKDNRAEK
jgi:hypothetical protein